MNYLNILLLAVCVFMMGLLIHTTNGMMKKNLWGNDALFYWNKPNLSWPSQSLVEMTGIFVHTRLDEVMEDAITLGRTLRFCDKQQIPFLKHVESSSILV